MTIACCCNVVDDLLQRLIIKNGLRVPSHVRKARYASGCRHTLADKSSGLRGSGLVHRCGFDWITVCLLRDLTGKRSRSVEINFADSGYGDFADTAEESSYQQEHDSSAEARRYQSSRWR